MRKKIKAEITKDRDGATVKKTWQQFNTMFSFCEEDMVVFYVKISYYGIFLRQRSQQNTQS